MAQFTEREDDVICYYDSREAAIAARNDWHRADEQGMGVIPDPKASKEARMNGTFKYVRGPVSMPEVRPSKKKPGKWYWIAGK